MRTGLRAADGCAGVWVGIVRMVGMALLLGLLLGGRELDGQGVTTTNEVRAMRGLGPIAGVDAARVTEERG